MPIQIDSVFYELALHDADFAAALRKAASDLSALDGPAKKADNALGGLENGMKSARNAANSLNSDLKRLGENLLGAFAIKAFIANTVEAQRAQAQLQAALRSTGGAAGFTLPQLEKLSEEFARLSTFSDEAVKGGLSRLLTYTGIQGPMFREAARATLDFAAALNIDVNSAAERVGNALQYPTEAINSLTKQGFRFTAEQKRLIAAFEDTGQLAKAQAIILGELDLAYKGSAEAARGTLGGALIALKNAFTDTLEVSKENSSGLIEAINSVTDAMPALREKFSAFFGGISLLAVDASIAAQKFFNLFRKQENRVSDEDLEALRSEEQRRILGLDRPPPPTTGSGGPAGNRPRGLTDAQLDAQRNARLAFAQATAAQTEAIADNFDAQVQRLIAAAQKAHLGAGEIQKMVNDLRAAHAKAMAEEGQKLALTLQGQLAELTATTVDDLRAQLAEFDRSIDEQRAKGVPVDPTVVNQLRAAKEQAIALAPDTERIAKAFERIQQSTAQGFNLTGAIAELDALITDAANISEQLPEGSAERAANEQRINDLVAKRNEIYKQLRAIIAATGTESQKFAVSVGNAASQVANIANVAFGLASAFSGANSELTKMLGSVSQIAGGISSISELASAKKGGFGELFSSASGILSALPGIGQAIGGGIALASSLFGKSPEEIARLQALKENNQRLRELSQHVGDLARISVQGTQLGSFQGFLNSPALQALLASNPVFVGQDKINRQIGAILDSLGLSAADLKEFAKQFGVTVGTGTGGKITLDDLRQLQKALADTELGQFADDFAGQMAKLETQIKLFDLKEPIQQFIAFQKALQGVKGGAGALTGILDKFDLSSAQGIEAAKKAIQDLFNQLQTASSDQLPALLGGLTADEFRQALERIRDIVNAQAGSGAVPGTGGFNVSREITEVTGSRLAAIASSELIFAEQTARNTSLIAQLLGGNVPTAINAPSVATPQSVGAGPLVNIESLTIEVNDAADAVTGQRAGEAAGRGFIDVVDRELGKRFKGKLRLQGVLS